VLLAAALPASAQQRSSQQRYQKTSQSMRKECYIVRYRVVGTSSSTTVQTTLMLYGPNETEALAELRRRGTVHQGQTVIILSIVKK